MLLSLASFASIVHAQQSDAVSREFTVFNDLSSGGFKDAVSREFTVFNNLASSAFTDAVSREFSVFKGQAGTAPTFTDAISPEFSVQNTFRCTGNLTDDGLVTTIDVPGFVDVIMGRDSNLYRQQAADVNCDGLSDGEDIQPFVAALLAT